MHVISQHLRWLVSILSGEEQVKKESNHFCQNYAQSVFILPPDLQSAALNERGLACSFTRNVLWLPLYLHQHSCCSHDRLITLVSHQNNSHISDTEMLRSGNNVYFNPNPQECRFCHCFSLFFFLFFLRNISYVVQVKIA